MSLAEAFINEVLASDKVAELIDQRAKMQFDLLAGIKFIHDSEGGNQRLDFFLPDHNVFIEVKQYHTDRIAEQMALKDNIIVLQGKQSVEYFIKLLK